MYTDISSIFYSEAPSRCCTDLSKLAVCVERCESRDELMKCQSRSQEDNLLPLLLERIRTFAASRETYVHLQRGQMSRGDDCVAHQCKLIWIYLLFFFFSLLFRIQPTTCAAEGSSQCCMMECESGYLALWRVIIIEHSGYSSDTWATFWPAICSKLLPNTTESLHMTDRQRLWLQWFICKTTQYLLMRSSFKSINRFWCFFSWRSVDLAPSFLKDWRCHDSFCRKPRSGVALRSGLFLWYPDVEWPLWQGENIFCYVKYLEEPSQVKVGCKGTWTLLQPTQGNNSSMLPQKGGYTTQVQRLLQLLPVQMSLLAVWFHSDGGTEEQLLWITSTSALK